MRTRESHGEYCEWPRTANVSIIGARYPLRMAQSPMEQLYPEIPYQRQEAEERYFSAIARRPSYGA